MKSPGKMKSPSDDGSRTADSGRPSDGVSRTAGRSTVNDHNGPLQGQTPKVCPPHAAFRNKSGDKTGGKTGDKTGDDDTWDDPPRHAGDRHRPNIRTTPKVYPPPAAFRDYIGDKAGGKKGDKTVEDDTWDEPPRHAGSRLRPNITTTPAITRRLVAYAGMAKCAGLWPQSVRRIRRRLVFLAHRNASRTKDRTSPAAMRRTVCSPAVCTFW
jgi:hypothetical protein